MLQQGQTQLEEGRSSLDEGVLSGARDTFTNCVHADGRNARCYYDLARAESYLSGLKQLQKDKKAAEKLNDSAIENVQHSIALDEGISDAHALLADLYGRKIGMGGMLAGPKFGPKANSETERALQLNPSSALAYLVLGHKFYYSPKMFGGNIDKAVESFQKATVLDPQSDEAFVWLAIAQRKKGDSSAANRALTEALRLNPKSAFARRIQSGAPE